MNYDTILEEVGEFGPWQRLVAALLWLPAMGDGIQLMMFSLAGIKNSDDTHNIVVTLR